jgi:diaminopimelate decarboxylase
MRKDEMSGGWPVTARRNDAGELTLGGVSVVELASEYGTPLYIFDEDTLRSRARHIRGAFQSAYANSRVVYAGKAYLSPSLMRILVDERIGLDVVSGGELYAGLLAGVSPAEIVFHGNNKSRNELEEAVDARVGLIALDNDHEISLLDAVANDRLQDVPVVLRLNPGVDPHTHHKMRTGATDSKFGFPVWDGQADAAAERVVATRHLRLMGYHAHVGSQIFDPELVGETIAAVMAFAVRVHSRFGVAPRVVIPGGGFGVADDASGADVSITEWAKVAAAAMQNACQAHNLEPPTLIGEPGRAIIGPAGIALYAVGARKVSGDGHVYVSIDGGMADNIRPALYGVRYSALLANRQVNDGECETITIAGKYCESGDILIERIELPHLSAGDLLAVPMAGAYCLAMASNYNLSLRPAVVLVKDGAARLIRRRETYDDLLRAEVSLTALNQ